jgi:hypothetical protein
MAIRFIEEVPSVYGYPTKEEMERNKERFWVALELFYIYGPRNSETSLEFVQKRICIQRKRMHTQLQRCHYVFGMTNGTKTYLRQ